MRTVYKLDMVKVYRDIVVVTLALVLATAGTSQGAFNKDELKCRKGIAKNFSKAIATAQKITSGCHKRRNAGKGFMAADNCNDLAVADTKNKFAKAQNKIAAQIQKCIDSGIDDDIRLLFISCPEPCSTGQGLPNPLTTYTELGTCLSCYAGDLAESFTLATQGSPTGVPMAAKEDQKCHQTIGKSYGKLLKTILKERTKCQNSKDKAGAMTVAETGCASADPKNKIGKAVNKAAADINKSCATATLANLASCSTVDLPSLITCLDGQTNTTADTAMPANYELAPTICPVALTTTVRAGATASGPASATLLEAGWNGVGHGQDLVDRYEISTAISCANQSPPCGDCTINGITDVGGQSQDFVRCEQDPTTPCAVPFTSDPACPGVLQSCGYYLGPPYPASASNTPVCIINKLSSDISGTVDIDVTGHQQTTLIARAVVHNGASQTKPCPICVGDTTPRDGVAEGICDGGTRDGLSCDVQGFDATFAPGEGLSLDCVPSLLQNVSGAGLGLNLELTTQSLSMPFGTKCDFPLSSLDCACALCSGDQSIACNSDAECVALGAGTCTSPGDPGRKPNACSDVVSGCVATVGNLGECSAGPNIQFCDGVFRANGRPFLTCRNNADCRTLDAACGDGSGGSCGNCTITEARPCFLNPIVATGTASTTDPVLVSTFCIPPTASSGINGATGLPGPARVAIQYQSTLSY